MICDRNRAHVEQEIKDDFREARGLMKKKIVVLCRIVVGCLMIAGLLSACTAKIVSRPADAAVPARGIAYHLPATELSYVMTFRLIDCGGAIEVTNAAIEQCVVPDRGAGTYLIDSSYFGNLSKTIPLAKINIQNGMLSSISYDAKDSTADIIKGSATLLGDVVAAVSPVKLPSLGGALTLLSGSRSLRQEQMIRSFQPYGAAWGKTGGADICNEATRNVLDEYALLRRHLNVMKRNLIEAEVQLVEKRDGVSERIQDIENVIRKTQDRIAELDKHLILQYRKPLLMEVGKCEGFGEIVLESAPFTKWFRSHDDQEAFRRQFQAWIEENKLSYTISHCQGQAQEGDRKARWIEALYYRMPAQCKLEVTKDTLLATSYVELMQCGRLAAVEITNGAFQNNSHRIEFDPLSGEIRSFEFRDNNVRASEALVGLTEATKTAKP